MEDEELLWRASFISLRDPDRRTGPKKIAFLFSFTSQLFFAPLWAKFFDGQEGKFSVYLHGSELSIDKATLPPVFHHRFVPVEVSSGQGCLLCLSGLTFGSTHCVWRAGVPHHIKVHPLICDQLHEGKDARCSYPLRKRVMHRCVVIDEKQLAVHCVLCF